MLLLIQKNDYRKKSRKVLDLYFTALFKYFIVEGSLAGDVPPAGTPVVRVAHIIRLSPTGTLVVRVADVTLSFTIYET